MRPPLPDRLGGEFWFSLVMSAIFLAATILGVVRGWGYETSISALLGLLYVIRLGLHVRKVRLARLLQRNPEIERTYYR